MNIALWIVQVLLAAAFGAGGWGKATMPMAEMMAKVPWAPDVSPGLIRFIGWAELAAAVGLILPAATRILPKLTAWAGIGLVVIMILAAGLHLRRGETAFVGINLILGAMAAFVAWGRLKAAPIAPRAGT